MSQKKIIDHDLNEYLSFAETQINVTGNYVYYAPMKKELIDHHLDTLEGLWLLSHEDFIGVSDVYISPDESDLNQVLRSIIETVTTFRISNRATFRYIIFRMVGEMLTPILRKYEGYFRTN